MTSAFRTRRLQSELKEINRSPPDNCSADLAKDDINKWRAIIIGPEKTPYENGIFCVDIRFGENYPFSPPSCKFLTRIYHPNIDRHGNICLDILKNNWTPAISVSKLLISICSLLDDPNPDDPLDAEASELYKRDITEFNHIARQYTVEYAADFVH